MNNSFNRNSMNNIMINSSYFSLNFGWINNWSIINSLSWRVNKSYLSCLISDHWLYNWLVDNSLSWNWNSLCSGSILYDRLSYYWSMVNILILSFVESNINIFSLNNRLDNSLSMNLWSRNLDNSLRIRDSSLSW